MGTIRVRFIVVALVVSFFAVGMAAFLNYFKYKSTISGIVKSRVLVIGRNIENSVQASLSVRVGEKVPSEWIEAAARSKTTEWSQEGPDEFVAGISLKNNFDLTVGYLALRYSAEEVDRAAKVAGREILLASIISFIGIALVAPLALVVVIRRFERDLRTLESAASHLEDRTEPALPSGSAFDAAIGNLRSSLREANTSLDDLRAKLDSVPP